MVESLLTSQTSKILLQRINTLNSYYTLDNKDINSIPLQKCYRAF